MILHENELKEASLPGSPPPATTGAQLRAMGKEELARFGQKSLEDYLAMMASRAHLRYRALSGDALYAYLSDPLHVRYPVRLAFSIGRMASHQFGQPELDPSMPTRAFHLYLHPGLQKDPDGQRLAVPFFIPFINFGDQVLEEQALLYGATLMGLPLEAYYDALCRMADAIGARPCLKGETHKQIQVPSFLD